jgi:hypothetical protein
MPLSSHFSDVPPGEAPQPATNLTLTPEAGGFVLRWVGPKEDPNLVYYTVQIRQDSQDMEWTALTDQKIHVDEASYLSKKRINRCMGDSLNFNLSLRRSLLSAVPTPES